jgi:hypothetical protein
VLLGHLRPHLDDLRLDLALDRFVHGVLDGRADCLQQYVGELERVASRDVEPVEQPVPDEVEVGSSRATRVAVQRAQ